MALYRYTKKPPVRIHVTAKPKKITLYINAVAKLLLVFGFIAVGNVVIPIISYELFTAPGLQSQIFLSPIPAAGNYQDNAQDNISKKEEYDLSKPQNWFPQAKFTKTRESKITHYNLSIPSLNIKEAIVTIGGEDLSKSLIHYPETALPGELGATVIFGHSVLPQFYNPTNYMTIFSLIPTLELGEEIIIKFDSITYTYKITDKVEVKPDNLSVLEQPYDNEYLRLITCTPPGTYLRRGVITAVLIN